MITSSNNWHFFNLAKKTNCSRKDNLRVEVFCTANFNTIKKYSNSHYYGF